VLLIPIKSSKSSRLFYRITVIMLNSPILTIQNTKLRFEKAHYYKQHFILSVTQLKITMI